MPNTLVTGCNRGIGLQLVTQLQARGDSVIGICRTSTPELNALGIRIIDGIDVSDGPSVQSLKAALGDEPLDILINNAGILLRDMFGDIDYDAMLRQYAVNALGPLRVTEALADNLHQGSKVAIVSSRVGSIDDNGSGGNWGYRDMIGTNLMHALKPRGIAVALLHPGLVATDMTGQHGISAVDSARGLIERINELTLENTGGFWHAEGYALPW
jgi:NAD(P)-dependent dehydrogenase (short-subunit alcohol dehydrogenase family)